MKLYTVFLGLGSNLGEREKCLNQAVGHLKKLRASSLVWASSVYETDPYGKVDQPKFLNAAVQIETSLEPSELFEEIKKIEATAGRSRNERWGPREIDIDILIYDGLVFESDSVKVPHPEIEKRKFVLVPLREIAPDLVHPVTGLNVEEMAAQCQDSGRVVKSLYRIVI